MCGATLRAASLRGICARPLTRRRLFRQAAASFLFFSFLALLPSLLLSSKFYRKKIQQIEAGELENWRQIGRDAAAAARASRPAASARAAASDVPEPRVQSMRTSMRMSLERRWKQLAGGDGHSKTQYSGSYGAEEDDQLEETV